MATECQQLERRSNVVAEFVKHFYYIRRTLPRDAHFCECFRRYYL